MTRSLPWTRLLAEGVVVVTSILLALAADGWQSNRQVEAERQQWLMDLEPAFATDAVQAAAEEERIAALTGLGRRIVSMPLGEVSQIPQDSVWLHLRALWRPNVVTLDTEAIVAALEAHPEFITEDDGLGRAVASWRKTEAVVRQLEERMWDFQDEIVAALSGYADFHRIYLGVDGGFSLGPDAVLAVKAESAS